MVGEEVGEDLEQVEEMQKKFDDYQKVKHQSDRIVPYNVFYHVLFKHRELNHAGLFLIMS